jgi:hypothetical protein
LSYDEDVKIKHVIFDHVQVPVNSEKKMFIFCKNIRLLKNSVFAKFHEFLNLLPDTFFFLWYWGLKSEPFICQAGTLLLEPHPQPLFALIVFHVFSLGLA